MAIFAMPAQAASKARTKVQTTKSAEAVKVSTQEFNKLKATLTSAISEMKSAASAKAVTNSMYNYTKSFLGMNKVYKGLTDYQKKQVDVLVKQFGVQSKAKIAKIRLQERSRCSLSKKATMEALSSLSK
ncbi:MAG: hypothetical protein L6U16_01850 [Porphyromonadaceae bacterium]|nr:MAG: hypothetical protein L6U16_01850 [Porphyromonadaceae bacterium]